MGEVSLGYEDWFGGALRQDVDADNLHISFADPRNKAIWHPLVSGRSRARVSGDVLVKIGITPASEWTALPTATPSTLHPERLPAERERELAEFFFTLQTSRQQRTSTAERVLSAPPTEGVGTITEDDKAGGRLGEGVGMGDPEAPDASDDDTSASEDESETGSTSDDDEEYGPFDNAQYAYTASPVPEPATDPLAAAGSRLYPADANQFDDRQPTSEPSHSRRGLSFPSFIRTASSKSVASLRSGTRTPSDSQSGDGKAPGRLNLRERLRTKSSSSNVHLDAGTPPVSGLSGGKMKKRMRRRRKGPKVGADYALTGADDVVGICFVEIVSAHDLPRWKNMSA